MDEICEEEKQEDYWCDSSNFSLQSVCQEFHNGMLDDHSSPSVLNENHHPTKSGSHTDKETLAV